jgi:single-strand DNA-binding protein
MAWCRNHIKPSYKQAGRLTNNSSKAQRRKAITFSDLNQLTISGRLGREPEFKVAGNSNPMASFSIASTQVTVDELYGVREETTWLNVIAWADNAQLVKGQLHKGDHVTLVGKLSIRKVENGAGDVRYFTQLVLDSFQKNDRANTKRNSGAGNGAERGSHSSQKTVAERFDNRLNPEVEQAR